MEALLEVAKVFGLPVALLVYFLWRDFMRQKKEDKDQAAMITRLRSVEDYVREKLENLITGNIAATQATKIAIDANTAVMKEMVDELRKKPCLKD